MRRQKIQPATGAARPRFGSTQGMNLFRCSTCQATNARGLDDDPPETCASCGAAFPLPSTTVAAAAFRANLGPGQRKKIRTVTCPRCKDERCTTMAEGTLCQKCTGN